MKHVARLYTDPEVSPQARHEYKSVLIAHGRALNRHAPNWTSHLDTLEHWLMHELSHPRDYVGAGCTGKECDT